MNVRSFLQAHGITEHPFLAEEAREDPVFSRLDAERTAHPEFDKIAGDLSRHSSSVVFGEKGSGKTAIRIRLAERAAEHNLAHPEQRVLLVPLDDLNPMLEHFARSQGFDERSPGRDLDKALSRITLADHLDYAIHRMVVQLVDELETGERRDDLQRRIRHAPRSSRVDLLVLAALYDTSDPEGTRRKTVRKAAALGPDAGRVAWYVAACLGWVLPALVFFLIVEMDARGDLSLILFSAALALWLLIITKVLLWDRMVTMPTVRRVAKALRTVPRGERSLRRGIMDLPSEARSGSELPAGTEAADRFDMLRRLVVLLQSIGVSSVQLVYDRIDEPVMVNGDVGRMRSIVWPLLSNKFLQMDGVGVKMLLPLELRYELFRESSEFFQAARMDKQNLVERLRWTGAMLYDLCTARLRVCASDLDACIELEDLFEDEVGRDKLVEALDLMQQPRDAFKMLYKCIADHCAAAAGDDESARIEAYVLEAARRDQAERLEAFSRGVRPA